MKKTAIKFILSAAAAAIAALLLAGCQEETCEETPKATSEHPEEIVEDTAAADTMEAFRERMQRWNLLHESFSCKPDK